MEWLVPPGVVVTLLGVAGLGYCIFRAFGLRRSGLEGEELAAELQKLIPINMGSVFVGAIGLGMVLIGRLL